MLVIDGVELVLCDQLQQVREFDSDDSLGSEQCAKAGHEVVEVGHVSQHVVGDEEVCLHHVSRQSRVPSVRRKIAEASRCPGRGLRPLCWRLARCRCREYRVPLHTAAGSRRSTPLPSPGCASPDPAVSRPPSHNVWNAPARCESTRRSTRIRSKRARVVLFCPSIHLHQVAVGTGIEPQREVRLRCVQVGSTPEGIRRRRTAEIQKNVV